MVAATSSPQTAPEGAAPDERAALGKKARKETKRSSHAVWEPPPARPDPVEVLERQAADRVAELLPLRYGRMLASPFTFYRGAAAIMAADLDATPSSGLWVQACGDAHLSNIGGYASPERTLVIDVNDFDETLPGPWEWDLKRLAASFEIAGRARDFSRSERERLVLTTAAAYRDTMRRLADLGNLEVWYERVDVARVRAQFGEAVSSKERRRFEKVAAKAQRKTRMRALRNLVRNVDGKLRLASNPPVLVPLGELFGGAQLEQAEAQIERLLTAYKGTLDPVSRRLLDSYSYVGAARKVVGVGSVGTRAWVILLVGRDGRDPLFLQAKEAQASVLEPYTAPSEFSHEGERVVIGQRLTQAASDIMLGWVTAIGPDGVERDFYVRQLWDQKGSAVVESMRPARLRSYAEVCGAVLARAHARTGDRTAIAAYLGRGDNFDRALAAFSASYADQNELDYKALAEAVEDGRVPAEFEPDR